VGHYCTPFCKKNTFRQKVFVFRTFITFFQEDPAIEELTPSDFTKYLKARKDANDLAAIDNDKKFPQKSVTNSVDVANIVGLRSRASENCNYG